MKRKILLALLLALVLVCLFAISVGAKELDKYCDRLKAVGTYV